MKKSFYCFIIGFMWPMSAVAAGLTPPTGLDDIDATDRNISLQWNASSGATEYRIYQVFTKEEEDLLATVSHATDYVVTQVKPFHGSLSNVALSPFTSYQFAVRASDGTFESGDSNIVAAATTHTWSGAIHTCLNGADHVPTRTELESVTNFSCSNKHLTNSDIDPLKDLKNLESLTLDNNDLNGTIPMWSPYLTHLSYLNLMSNRFTSFGTDLFNLSDLETLTLNSNALSGEIPDALYSLSSLKSLRLENNNLNGTLSDKIGQLNKLTYLDLSKNNLTGSIPATIGNLTSLHIISLSGNQFKGVIPSTIGNLTMLESIYLDNNRLYGTIPSTIGNDTNITYLNLGFNDLSGPVPSSITHLDKNKIWTFKLGYNCRLYSDDQAVIDFIDDLKNNHWSSVDSYSEIINTNSKKCFIPAQVPIITYELN